MTRVQPDEECDRDREVETGVVDVAEPHERRVRQHQSLHGDLIRQVEHPFRVPHPLGVPDCTVDPRDRQLGRPLPQGEQAEHDRGFTAEATDGPHRRSARTRQEERHRREAAGQHRRDRPRDPEARHAFQSDPTASTVASKQPKEHRWT
jgi:hypothetical protein